MDGRWTIRVERSNVFVDGAWLPDRSTPVVPCDDAAVERVAAALFPHIPSPYTDDEADRFARSLALMALRAAGDAS